MIAAATWTSQMPGATKAKSENLWSCGAGRATTTPVD
jgi:hypothetical protein